MLRGGAMNRGASWESLVGSSHPAHAEEGDGAPGVADAVGDPKAAHRRRPDGVALVDAPLVPGRQVMLGDFARMREEYEQQAAVFDDAVAPDFLDVFGDGGQQLGRVAAERAF